MSGHTDAFLRLREQLELRNAPLQLTGEQEAKLDEILARPKGYRRFKTVPTDHQATDSLLRATQSSETSQLPEGFQANLRSSERHT